jgi:hypothetical protein
MDRTSSDGDVYYCPMHTDVRRPAPGKCPRCGMDLVAEGTRFALLRHMFGHPMHVAIMAAVMAAIMAAAMMMLR